MSTLSVRLPNSLHKRLRELAKSEGISMNQLIASAVSEKLTALMAAEYFEERAQRSSREKFERVLAKVPDVEPSDFDRKLDKSLPRTRRAHR